MTQDEIIRMAREAGFEVNYYKSLESEEVVSFDPIITYNLERFAALVAAHEREKYKAMDKELAELYEMAVNQAKTIKKYQDAVLAEREACAKVCESIGDNNGNQAADNEAYECAAAIRARGAA